MFAMDPIRSKDIPEDVVRDATTMWRNLAKKAHEENNYKDIGSCVLGDGIWIHCIPPRCRKPRWVELISPAAVSQCQGSAHYEKYVEEVIEFLESRGLPVMYNYGRMD